MVRFLLPVLLLASAAPAAANGGTPVPEPSNLALFALGVIGVIVGRRGARGRRPRDDE